LPPFVTYHSVRSFLSTAAKKNEAGERVYKIGK